ncbi:MAG: Clp protease ClpP [Alistipes sp.]|nr:Clp protease ClpP [Alistipes sp.]
MKEKIKISANATTCIIDIEGTIGVPEECQFESAGERVATYERFREQVARISEIEQPSVIVNIRSAGGDVNDALLIYEALTTLDAHIVTRCYGYTASAATIIAQAASEGYREISQSALYLIHRSSCAVEGNCESLSAQVELLRKTDERLAALYAERSGGDVATFEELMSQNNGNGRWLSPEEAVEAGLVDTIIGTEQKTEQKRTLAGRISEWLGIGRKEQEPTPRPLPADHNILHDPLIEQQQRRSAIALDQGQRGAKTTSTKSVEDPGIEDSQLSQNATAYSRDAMSFHRL